MLLYFHVFESLAKNQTPPTWSIQASSQGPVWILTATARNYMIVYDWSQFFKHTNAHTCSNVQIPSKFHPNPISQQHSIHFPMFIHFHSFWLKSSRSYGRMEQPRILLPKKASRRVLRLRRQVLLTAGTLTPCRNLWKEWGQTGCKAWKIRDVHPWNRNMGD